MTEVLALQRLHLDAATGERWWGGAVADGQLMPFGAHQRLDLSRSAGIAGEGNERFGNNQSAPLLLSSAGRFVWSEAPFDYEITDGVVDVVGQGTVHGRSGGRLDDAFRAASAAFFRTCGKMPAPQMLRTPRYNGQPPGPVPARQAAPPGGLVGWHRSSRGPSPKG